MTAGQCYLMLPFNCTAGRKQDPTSHPCSELSVSLSPVSSPFEKGEYRGSSLMSSLGMGVGLNTVLLCSFFPQKCNYNVVNFMFRKYKIKSGVAPPCKPHACNLSTWRLTQGDWHKVQACKGYIVRPCFAGGGRYTKLYQKDRLLFF